MKTKIHHPVFSRLMLAFPISLAAVFSIQQSYSQSIGGRLNLTQTLFHTNPTYVISSEAYSRESNNGGVYQNPFGDQVLNWSGISGAVGGAYYSAAVPYLPNNKRTYMLEYGTDLSGMANVASASEQANVWIDDSLTVVHVPGPDLSPAPTGPMRIRFKFHVKWAVAPENGQSWSLVAGASLHGAWYSGRSTDYIVGGNIPAPINSTYWTPLQGFNFGQCYWFQINMAYLSEAGWASGFNVPNTLSNSTHAKMIFAGAEVVDGAGNTVDPSHWELYRGGTPGTITSGSTGNAMASGIPLPDTSLGAVSYITSAATTLNGAVNPHGFLTSARFDYGLTSAYGSTTTVTLAPSDGTADQAASASLTGLSPGTTYHYRLSATNDGGTANTTDATFTTLMPTLAEWRQIHFLTPDNTGDAADLADPDQDGLKNLVEFAFGLNPNSGSSLQLPQQQRSGDNFIISFTEPAGISGVTYSAEWGPVLDSGTWLPVSDSGIGGVHTFSVPIGTHTAMFMRLKVTKP